MLHLETSLKSLLLGVLMQALPPFVIFNAKNLNIDWTQEEVPGTTYSLSDSGWMDMQLFNISSGLLSTLLTMLMLLNHYYCCLTVTVLITIWKPSLKFSW